MKNSLSVPSRFVWRISNCRVYDCRESSFHGQKVCVDACRGALYCGLKELALITRAVALCTADRECHRRLLQGFVLRLPR